MKDIRTVNIELIREGPPDNQLLSPLTRYLALCGNFPNSTFHVPYEHRRFLNRLKKLRYEEGTLNDPVARQAVLDEVAEDLARMLASIPGLQSSLPTDTCDGNLLTHINLVMSPAELALLPFEMAKVPTGFPGGEGNWLSLQTRLPIVLTRQIRSAVDPCGCWPTKPKILFVASRRGGSIPLEPHLDALLKAIQPWLGPLSNEDRKELDKISDTLAREQAILEKRVGKILTVLPNATLAQIEDLCSKTAFTHVHVLAHGKEDEKREGRPFGLAFGTDRNPETVDVVSGARFAAAIRPLRTEDSTPPAVVTVASCDSGNLSSMIVHNCASFAHELHQGGVPLVVASQFPLSFAGSIHMVEVLYDGLLWGNDPREVLHQLRSKLFALHAADTHDWASVIVYAALPEKIADQLEDTRYEQAKEAINAALGEVDEVIRGWQGSKSSGDPLQVEERIETLFKRTLAAKDRMPVKGAYETEGWGMKASTEKRQAQLLFHLGETWYAKDNREKAAEALDRSFGYLQAARGSYLEAVRQNLEKSDRPLRQKPSVHWVLVQHLSLDAVVGEEPGSLHEDRWFTARLSALTDLEAEKRETRAWAHGSLLELYLLALGLPLRSALIKPQEARKQALTSWHAMVSLADKPFIIASTRRQLLRYTDWWGHELFTASLTKKGIERAADWSPEGPLLTTIRELLAAAR